MLLARYARKLLLQYRIYDLYYLSKVVLDKKLAEILHREPRSLSSSSDAPPSSSGDSLQPSSPETPPTPPPASSSFLSFFSFSTPSTHPVEQPDLARSDSTRENTHKSDEPKQESKSDEVNSEENKSRYKQLQGIINSNDFGPALFSLHIQFNVPFPTRYSTSPHFTLLSSLHAGLGEGGIALGNECSFITSENYRTLTTQSSFSSNEGYWPQRNAGSVFHCC